MVKMEKKKGPGLLTWLGRQKHMLHTLDNIHPIRADMWKENELLVVLCLCIHAMACTCAHSTMTI